MSKQGPQTPAYWYGDAAVPWFARLLAPAYGAVTGLRRGLYRRGWLRARQVPVPVIVVGNITAGGTGKTPLTIELVNRLREAGWKPGVASRGYGRDEADTPRWVTPELAPGLGGDEPVLIAWKTGAPVRVDKDRVAAAKALLAAGCDIVICDDGLQHYRLARDIEIEVVDAARRYGNGRLMPAGPLREPVARARLCDFRVVNLGQASDAPPRRRPPGPDLVSGRCACGSKPPLRSRGEGPSPCRPLPGSGCTRWPVSPTRSASSRCCARAASAWCRMRLPIIIATRPGICPSAASCRY